MAPILLLILICYISSIKCLPTGCMKRYVKPTSIDCRESRLTSVPVGLPQDTTTLGLDYNRITSLNNVNWSGLASLQTLSLSFNRITSLNNVNWSGLASLQTLITSLNNANWSSLVSLQTLYLNNNNITSLNDANWTGLTSLTTLYLYNNNIANFRDADWTGLTSLTYLDIEVNPAVKHCHSSICLLYSIGKANTTIYGIKQCDIKFCEARPRVSVLTMAYNVSAGEDITIKCTVIPVRPAEDQIKKVTWLHNKKTINTELGKYSSGTVTTPSLTITFVQLEDEGGYKFVAQTSHGFVSESDKIQLIVKVNGGWSDWSDVTWAGCSTTCGYGARQGYRSRTCTNPSPTHGGSECKGVNMTYQAGLCNIKECPINGNWSEWSDVSWTGCSTTCGNGSRQGHISRTCTNPSPKYGGSICEGLNMTNHTSSCNIRECPTATPADNTWIIIIVAVITGVGGVLIAVLVCVRCNTNRSQYMTNRQDEGMYDQIDETEMREFERQDADRRSILSYEHPYFQPLNADAVSYEHPLDADQVSTSRQHAYQPLIVNRENAHTEDVRDSYTDAMSRKPKSNTDREVRHSYTDALSVLPEGDTASKRRNTH